MLIEVMAATAAFAFVAFAGLEALRELSADVALLAQRSAAHAQLRVVAARMRTDALSATAIWKPPSSCGDALALLQRDAAGSQFALYLRRGNALVHAVGSGPLDPCDPALVAQTLLGSTAGFAVSMISADALPAHRDPIAGAPDGGLLAPGGITAVVADAHARDVDGSAIVAGNAVAEVTIDAQPVVTVLDLVAGNRPNGFAAVLAYDCGGRCAANGPFPELRGAAVVACDASIDFGNAPAYYVPATFALVGANGVPQIRVASYWVTGAYVFSFAGPDARVVRRNWTPTAWPPGAGLSDPYPVSYATSALAAAAPAQIAADVGAAAAYAPELAACAAFDADALYPN